MIKIIQGDITTLAVDAIVNAAKRAVREMKEFLAAKNAKDAEEMEVVFCCFSERDVEVYEEVFCDAI